MAHGDAREGKWRGNLRMEWVASTLHTTSEHGVSSITTADAHTSADLNGLVRFVERLNLVSAHVPSHFERSLHPEGKPFFFFLSECHERLLQNFSLILKILSKRFTDSPCRFSFISYNSVIMLNVKKPHNIPGQFLRVPGGWGSQISRESAHEGGKVVSPTQRQPSPSRKYSWYSFLLETESTPGP